MYGDFGRRLDIDLLAGVTMHDEPILRGSSPKPIPRGASVDHPIEQPTMHTEIEAWYEARGYVRFGPTNGMLRKFEMEDCIKAIAR